MKKDYPQRIESLNNRPKQVIAWEIAAFIGVNVVYVWGLLVYHLI